MMEFLKKATEWMLEKEQEAADNCKIELKDVEKQITYLQDKKEKLKKEYEDNIAELDHVLERLEVIKEHAKKCELKK